MALEDVLERIAVALESLVGSKVPGAIYPDVPTPVVEVKKPKKKGGRPKKAAPVVAVPDPILDADEDDEPDVVTIDDITSACQVMVRNKNEDQARAILGEFGATRISLLEEKDYVDCLKRLNEVNDG